MAKIVIAGAADCPYYAKVEILADNLVKNVPDFQLHKILLKRQEWEDWLQKTCESSGWKHAKSPLVWRELVDRGGRGILIGGANEFQEYVMGYYNLKSNFTADDMYRISKENEQTKIETDKELLELKAESHPVNICITNSSSPVCYNMLTGLANGEALGDKTETSIRLYEPNMAMEGEAMETVDLALSLVKEADSFSNIYQAFTDCNVVVLLDEIEKDEEETKNAWLKRNYEVFANYGNILNEVADPNVKVLISGKGPINFNAHSVIKNAPKLHRHNIVAMSRLVENEAKALLANKIHVNSANVVDVLVWGNINEDKFIDTSHARVHRYQGAIWGPPTFSLPLTDTLTDNKWMSTELGDQVKGRYANVEEVSKHRPSMSEASAIISLLKHWHLGSPSGQCFSLGVCSEGEYNVPEGLVFSLPVTFHPKGYWIVVQDIDVSEEVAQKIEVMVKELEWETGCPTREDPVSVTQQVTEEALDMQTQLEESQKGSEKGSQAGSKAGSQAGSKAGSQAGSKAGSQAGSKAGSQAGSKAGSQAGSKPGSQAGSRAGSRTGSRQGEADEEKDINNTTNEPQETKEVFGDDGNIDEQ